MSSWDDEHVRDLVDELERLDKVSPAVADRARTAVAEGRHREALDLVLDRTDEWTAGTPSRTNGHGSSAGGSED
ncbi:hypothetical protein JCM17823_22310 [Halorubrum gandharaense]